jgi:hypothetical protein
MIISNLPLPLFIKEGIISSFQKDIQVLTPPFLKGDRGGLPINSTEITKSSLTEKKMLTTVFSHLTNDYLILHS